MDKFTNTQYITEIKQLVKYLLNESSDITSFAGFDLGIGVDRKDMTYLDESLNYCQDFEIGVLNQGFFQMTTFNEDKWRSMREYVEKSDDIAQINFFFVTTSLVDAAAPIMAALPFINIYHTGIGVQLVGKNGKIKRTAMIQLEFGDIDSSTPIGDATKRFLTPQFCMTPVIDPATGIAKNPLQFTDQEFSENLFIDYSKSISTIMCNWLESEDYITDKLIQSMGCTDAINVRKTSPMPYDDFLRQNFKMSDFFNAYQSYRNNKDSNVGGMADGSIFELCGFGPSPIGQKSGVIINFASTTDKNELLKIFDYVFTNFNGCTNNMNNANQHYCLIGIDKVTPIKGLSKSDIDNLLKKPNIISTENGFIREVKGRTTHCNTTCAVLITLIEAFQKESPKSWTLYTDWENAKVQESNFYMLNPAIPHLPLAVFPVNWENGVSMKEFNTNPLYAEDKKHFYKYMFFIRMLANGMAGVGEGAILNNSESSLYQKLFYYVIQIFQNPFAKDVVKFLFSKNVYSKYQYTYILLLSLLLLYIVVSLDLFEYAYWATGQSIIGDDIMMTDPYPTIWKIDIKNNKDVLLAYIKNFLFSYQNNNYTGESAGDIYYDGLQKKSFSMYDDANVLNRWLHPFPLNKFFLWFPGIKLNNYCDNVQLPQNLVFYQPAIIHQLVGSNQSNTLALTKWTGYLKNNDGTIVYTNGFDNRITLTLVITVILLILAISGFAYFVYLKKT